MKERAGFNWKFLKNPLPWLLLPIWDSLEMFTSSSWIDISAPFMSTPRWQASDLASRHHVCASTWACCILPRDGATGIRRPEKEWRCGMLRMPDTKASPNPNCICLIALVAAATSPISAMLHFERPTRSWIAGWLDGWWWWCWFIKLVPCSPFGLMTGTCKCHLLFPFRIRFLLPRHCLVIVIVILGLGDRYWWTVRRGDWGVGLLAQSEFHLM